MNDVLFQVIWVAHFLTSFVAILTPLLCVLLPVFAFVRSKKWLAFVVFQALASLFVWAVLTLAALYLLVLNFAAQFLSFETEGSQYQITDWSYLVTVLVVCLPYSLLNGTIVAALAYAIKAQSGWKKADDPTGL